MSIYKNKMGLKSNIRKFINNVFKQFDYELVHSQRLYEWQKDYQPQPSYSTQSWVSQKTLEYLRLNNPKLLDLHNRYDSFNSKVTAPLVWTDGHVRPEDILYFRGDNAYVYQLRGPNMNPLAYALTAYYIKSIDKLGLLNELGEDNIFGNYTFHIDNMIISRDLLDSIVEIYFLERHLNLSNLSDITVLDIGAGYGRLAHRMTNALPNIKEYLCTDGVAISSFISEYYLRFRGLENISKMIPLDRIENKLSCKSVDLAINIHSFSECKITAIDWWLSLLEKSRVKYLMIVPNAGDHGGKRLLTSDGNDFGAVIEKHGYKLLGKDPKFRDPIVQKYAINPTYHYLFQLHEITST